MQDALSPWLTNARSEWESNVQAWLAEVALAHNLGEIETITTLKERPWSLVRRVDFEGGITYFKACAANGQHELDLLEFLEKQPHLPLPQLIANQPTHKWILLADAGMPLRNLPTGTDRLSVLAQVLSSYAQLQITSLAWCDQLLSMGLPDRRVSRLPTLLVELLADDVIGTGQSADELKRLRQEATRLLPRFEKFCVALGESPYADALDHGDFHASNVVVQDSQYAVIDWGDACITHPFCSFHATLETASKLIPEGEQEHWVAYLRDAYLEPWGGYNQREELLADFERAQWVAHIGRVLDFIHMFVGADEGTLNQWRPMIFERLEMWVHYGTLHEF